MLTQFLAIACLAAPPKIATGTVESLTSRSVTITAKGAGTLKLTYDSDTDVTVDGHRSEGARIPKGSSVSVTYDPEELYAKKLRCVSPASKQAKLEKVAKEQAEAEEQAGAEQAEMEAAVRKARAETAKANEEKAKREVFSKYYQSIKDETILGEVLQPTSDLLFAGTDVGAAMKIREAAEAGAEEIDAVLADNRRRFTDLHPKAKVRVTKVYSNFTALDELQGKIPGPTILKVRVVEVPAEAPATHPKAGAELYMFDIQFAPEAE